MAETFSLIIHGGSASYDLKDPIEAANHNEQEQALARIIESGWKRLARGDRSIDVVEYVINLLEETPCFNSGIGAAIGAERQVELDASIMVGDTLQCGAAAGIRGVPHAISVARAVMEKTNHVMLVGDGLDSFISGLGFERLRDEDFYTAYQQRLWDMYQDDEAVPQHGGKGTVGAVARDSKGSISAGTSTGGMTMKMRGRVGDSPLIGSGTYADSRYGGVSCTGYGEQIIKVGMARTAIHLIKDGYTSQEACDQCIDELGQLKQGLGGMIAIDATGRVGACGNERFLPVAFMTSQQIEPVVEFDISSLKRSLKAKR